MKKFTLLFYLLLIGVLVNGQPNKTLFVENPENCRKNIPVILLSRLIT
jgi:hypothetical protein